MREGHWKTHKYYRHSVDSDVQEFVGWNRLKQLFDAMPNLTIRDVEVAAFLTAARITEALALRKNMFMIQPEKRQIAVKDFVILKRWRKVDMTIICRKCDMENGKYEVVCEKCGANLIYAGKKKFVTEKVEKKRLTFYIPLNEAFIDLLINRVKDSKDWLFPSPYTGRPYTRQWAYSLIKPLGDLVGLKSADPKKEGEPNLYNHWFRAQRLMQLGNEYGFDEMELKAFSGIVKIETLSKYAKKVKSYKGKMGLDV